MNASCPPSRRQALHALGACAAGLSWPRFARAAEWPSRTVRWVTAAGPGDPNDLVLRRLTEAMRPELNNMAIVVDNKPGAGGVLAHQDTLRSAADGYTVMVGNAAMTILPSLHKKLPYNPSADFAPVCIHGSVPVGLCVPAARPEKTYKEWAAWAKTQKGKLNYGSGGNGTVPHLYGFQMSEHLDVDATHIAYKGNAAMLREVVGGALHFAVIDIFQQRAFLQSGQLRLLAMAGTERSKFVPEAPTFAELGVPGFDRQAWNAWFVRKGTPQAMIDRLAEVSNRTWARPEWAALRDQFWIEWKEMTPAQIGQQVVRETAAWAEVVKRSGYVPE